MQRQRPGFATSAVRPLVLWCLMLVLPVYGWSATLAELLGALHSHAAPPARTAAVDPLAGWQDFRRVVHGAADVAAVPSHQHAALARHLHGSDDASVVVIEPANATDVAADGQPTGVAAVVFAFDRHAIGVAAAPRERQWRASGEAIPTRLAASRLERPPKA